MKKFFISFLFITSCFYTNAEIFIVTTSADAGSGSLREAIISANANGTASLDEIHFNIPQLVYNDRLIHIQSELPPLSSNIIIDGTTQPGAHYGNTDAKICLIKTDYVPSFSFITVKDAENIKIFGLHIYYGYWEGFFGSPSRSISLYGININNSSKIEIGAPAKGNVITGVVHGIFSNSQNCSEVKIRSNYLGQGHLSDGDDIDPIVVQSSNGITFNNVKDITIGGPQTADGNVFGSQNKAISIMAKNPDGNGSILIQNNYLGYKYDTTLNSDNISGNYVAIGKPEPSSRDWIVEDNVDFNVDFLDNTISACVYFNEVSGSINILRNKWYYQLRFGGGFGFKIQIIECSGTTMIGNENESDANQFLGQKMFEDAQSIRVVTFSPINIGKNKFECNSVLGSTTSINYVTPVKYVYYSPFIQIDKVTANSVEGRAEPDSKVDIFYDDECSACEGKKYLATTIADASGVWKYTGPVLGTVVAMATDKNGYSGVFSHPTADVSNVKIIQPSCGNSNGSITQITTEGAEDYFWLNSTTKDTVSKTLDLLNVPGGTYILYGVHGGTCISYLHYVELKDNTPVINTDGVSIIQPSCGLANGSINDITVFNTYNSKYSWVNSGGDTISTTLWIDNLLEGVYKFVVTDTITGCYKTKDFTLKNQSGPSIDLDGLQIIPAKCGQNNGGINGIVFQNTTGSLFLKWEDSAGNFISNNLELINAYPGKYRLIAKDETGCDTIITPYFNIKNQGVLILDTLGKIIIPTNCSDPSGSIQNIKSVGAEHYEWIMLSNNLVVGRNLDVFDLPAGNYQLRLSNSFCEIRSPIFNVPQKVFEKIIVTSIKVNDAFCGVPNGSITVKGFDKDASDYKFNWQDSASSMQLGTQLHLENLAAGSYILFGKDKNGCTERVTNVHLTQHDPPKFNYTTQKSKGDECDLKNGSISGIIVEGLTGPYTFRWYNEQNEQVASTVDVSHLSKGTYVLKITDVGECEIKSNPITITSKNISLETPEYNEHTILRNTRADLIIKNYSQGEYHLYKDEAGTQLIQKNDQGNFSIGPLASDTAFYIRKVLGSCQSPLAKIIVKVVDQYFSVPNAFSPNGDGLNDVFKVINPLRVTSFTLSVFNRFGQKVFETTDINRGWDGTFLGKLQPVGIYLWIVQISEAGKDPYSNRGVVMMVR